MPKPQPACKHGHPWTEQSTYLRSDGKRLCRICRARRQRDARMSVSNTVVREPQRKPEAEPVSVKWWRVVLPALDYSKEQAVRTAIRLFEFAVNHEPSIVLAHKSRLVKLPNVTVRIAGSNEPKPTSTNCFYLR